MFSLDIVGFIVGLTQGTFSPTAPAGSEAYLVTS